MRRLLVENGWSQIQPILLANFALFSLIQDILSWGWVLIFDMDHLSEIVHRYVIEQWFKTNKQTKTQRPLCFPVS